MTRSWETALVLWQRALMAGGNSRHTIRSYVGAVRGLFLFLGGGAHGVGVTRGEVERWIVEKLLAGKSWDDPEVKPATIKQRVAAVKAFQRWAIEDGQLRDSTVLRLKVAGPKGEKEPPPDNGDIWAFLRRARAKRKSDFVFLLVLYQTGMRVEELAALNVADVNPDSGRLVIHRGKGRRERSQYLPREAARVLRQQLRGRGEPGPDEPALLNSRGRRFVPDNLRRRMERYQSRGQARVTPHTLRHAYASQMLEHGADIREVQVLLGHKNIQTTAGYAHVRDRGRRATVRAHAPAALGDPQHRPAGIDGRRDGAAGVTAPVAPAGGTG